VIASARSGNSVCWIYGWTRRLTVRVLALMHALRRGSGPHELACTACCTAQLYNLVWTSFALRTLA
jgi:hypothetical protein